ncbi:hypothetical protein [Pseudoxanthomonas sp. 10H]|uniref:hypothetical protein n=1 Tax=Pseudoxanthomonas sp. 10H TaxID=3242729 RepID=UPI00355651E6
MARALSLVLHPFGVFMGLALVAAWRLDPPSLPRVATGMAVVVGIAWGFAWRRWRSGRWSTVDASRPQERPVLYLLALVLAIGYWRWLGGGASPLSGGVLAAVAMLCAAGLANRWIKLSLHLASLAFAGIVLLAVWRPAGCALLALVPALAWSRLALGRHRLEEVVGGALLGGAAGWMAVA